MAEVVTLRHGLTIHNQQGILTGRGDSELSSEGVEQVVHRAAYLGRAGLLPTFGVSYSSDQGRALQTGIITTEMYDLPRPIALPVLRERHMGEATGKTREEIIALGIPESSKIRTAFGVTYCEDEDFGFETFAAATKRAEKFIRYIRGTHSDGERVWVFTHGDFILPLTSAWTGVPVTDLLHELYVKNTDTIVLKGRGSYEHLELAA